MLFFRYNSGNYFSIITVTRNNIVWKFWKFPEFCLKLIQHINSYSHVTKYLYATYELEDHFAKAAMRNVLKQLLLKLISDLKSCPYAVYRKFRHQEIRLNSCILCSANKNSEI